MVLPFGVFMSSTPRHQYISLSERLRNLWSRLFHDFWELGAGMWFWIAGSTALFIGGVALLSYLQSIITGVMSA